MRRQPSSVRDIALILPNGWWRLPAPPGDTYRPGGVDTAMQAWIRQQDPERIGAALHGRFNRSYAEGALISPERSAAALLGYPSGDDTGAIWDVSAAPVRP